MKVLFWGVLIIAIALAAHLIVWRAPRVKTNMYLLLKIFMGALLLSIVSIACLSRVSSSFKALAPEGFLEYLHIILFVMAVTFAYLITYSAVEASSPSVMMVLAIAKYGAAGMEKGEFDAMMSDAALVVPRLRDLVNDRLIRDENGRYSITPAGSLFIRPFTLYRAALGLPKGG